MATDTTGSTVNGLKRGLQNHFGGTELMYVIGNPSGIIAVHEPGAAAQQGTSGACLAFDKTNNVYYQHVTGNQWIKLGSTSF